MRSDIQQLEKKLELNRMFLKFLALILVLLLMAMAVVLFKIFSGVEPLEEMVPFQELTIYEQQKSPKVELRALGWS